MRGTVEVPSDATILRPWKLEPRRLAPEILERVTLPRFLGEHVQYAVEVIEHDPTGRLSRVGAARQQFLLLLEAQLHLVGDRARLTLVAGRADRQEVGVRDE